MNRFTLDILYEDNHLLAVNKPAGLATMGLPNGGETLLTLAKAYLRKRYNKPGNVYLGVVSRLDVPVSGVVVFARTSKSAARLNDQFRERRVEKIYHAVVEGRVKGGTVEGGLLIHHLCEDKRHRKMGIDARSVFPPGALLTGAKEARLRYTCLKYSGNRTLLEVRPETGRKHQIRLQLAHIGHPILGDRKYGAKTPFPGVAFDGGIALHAKRLVVVHPVTKHTLALEAPLPPYWSQEFRTQSEK